MGSCWDCLGEVLSSGVEHLGKLAVLEHTYFIMSDSLLTNHVFLKVFQNTSFPKDNKEYSSNGTAGACETQWRLLSVGQWTVENVAGELGFLVSMSMSGFQYRRSQGVSGI